MLKIFLSILNMSITASWLILAVLLIRNFMKKAPKSMIWTLWIMVAIRLVIPFSFESIYSLIPSNQTIPESIVNHSIPSIHSGVEIIDNVINPIISNNFVIVNHQHMNGMKICIYIACIVWAIGVISMFVYSIVSYVKLKRQVSASLNFKDNIYFCDDIDTPFILGVCKPNIYIPSFIKEDYIESVLAHENAHLRRKDHIWKMIGYIILSIHWFNPFAWIAYILFGRDIELACDELVIKAMQDDLKKEYCEALISFSEQKQLLLVCPLTFGEIGVKERIKTVANYKKPTFWIILVSAIVCISVCIGFMSNPMNSSITNIKDRPRKDYSNFLNDVNEVTISNGYTTSPIIHDDKKAEIIDSLKNIKISQKPISDDGAIVKDSGYSITLNNTKKIYFNSDFSQLYIDDGIFCSNSYRIKNISDVEKIFKWLHTDKEDFKIGENLYSIDVFITNVDNKNIEVSGCHYPFSKYILTLDINEDYLTYYKQGQMLRIFYSGFVTTTDPATITDIEEVYFLHKTTVTSNIHEVNALHDPLLQTALDTRIRDIENQVDNFLYTGEESFYSKYMNVYVYYDEEESKKIVKEKGLDETYLAIFEKYYGGNVLEPTKEEGYGYVFYRYVEEDGVKRLDKRSHGSVIYK